MVNKIKLFFSLDIYSKLLLIEALLFLAWARVLKSKSFAKVAPKLGEQMVESTYTCDESNVKILRQISQAIQIMSRYTFWESMCLVKAIAGLIMLERRNIESTLYLGTAKDENGNLIAHAWLRSGPYYITGFEEMGKFSVVSKFAKRLGKEQEEGEKYE
ncbi:lasso peptide biosynthesis B2 protein [Neobacillus drentensis]|uniref:lasso peptide biosynthesis B2 protein n=1 Tax=Neobacillus drentensis TaxID=220684 RepID=UPI002FFD96BD